MYTTRSIVDVHLLDAMLLLFLLLDLRFDITHSIFHRSHLPSSVHRLFTALACRVVHSRSPPLLYAKVVQQKIWLPFLLPSSLVAWGVRLECDKGPVPPVIRGCIRYV